MNAAEKARLAREKKQEQAEQKRKKQIQKTTSGIQKTTGMILLVATIICVLVSFVFGIKLLTHYTEGLDTMEILFGGNRSGNLDLELASQCWAIIGVDAVVLGISLLHARWCDKFYNISGEAGAIVFVLAAVAIGIFFLELLMCVLMYWAAQ